MTATSTAPEIELTLEELWGRANAEDPAAVDALCTRVHALALANGKRGLVHGHEAEELAQEVVLSVLDNLHELRCPKNLKGFVWYRSMSVAGGVRRRRGRHVRTEAAGSADPPDTGTPSPWRASAEKETLLAVRACVDRLPLPERQCIQRRYGERESARGIASTLNVSHTMILKRLRTAFAALDACLRSRGIEV